jgi:hypothetical protein
VLALREWLHPSKWEIIGNVERGGRRVIYQVWRQLVAVHGKKIDVIVADERKEKEKAVCRVMTWCNQTSAVVATCHHSPIPHKGLCTLIIYSLLLFARNTHSLTSCHIHPLTAREADQFGPLCLMETAVGLHAHVNLRCSCFRKLQ